MHNNLLNNEEVCFQQKKRNMADYVGKNIQVSGWFVRFGHISNSFDDEDVTILIKRPYTIDGKEFVQLASHIWIKYDRSFQALKLRHGDKITFTATVSCYQRSTNGHFDFSLVDVSRPGILYRNNEPNSMRIFNQEIPFLKESQCYLSLKAAKKTIWHRPIKIDGKKIHPGKDPKEAPVFEIKLKDVSKNAFRFLFRIKGTQKWHRYAYFIPKYGERLTLTLEGGIFKLAIPDECYYALKDAWHLFVYNGEFRLPLNSKDVYRIKSEDEESSTRNAPWPSQRQPSRVS